MTLKSDPSNRNWHESARFKGRHHHAKWKRFHLHCLQKATLKILAKSGNMSLISFKFTPVISYFSVRNYWLIWLPFSFIVESHSLFGVPFTIKEVFFQFQGCLITYRTRILCPYQFRIGSSSVIKLVS